MSSLSQENEASFAEAKARFFCMAGHELRGPLASVGIGVEMLARHHAELDSEERKKVADRVVQQVSRTREIMDKFLTLGRIFSGTMAFQPTPVRIGSLVEKWMALHWGAEPGVSTERVLAKIYGAPGERSLDEALVTHVVFNLVGNALKFSDPCTGVFVLVSAEASMLRIQVRDNGCGIPGEDRDKVFEAFERGVSPYGTNGSGLGLFLARECAVAHEGNLRVLASGPEGTIFEFLFPAPVIASSPFDTGGLRSDL